MKFFVQINGASIRMEPPYAPTFRHEDPTLMCFKCNREFKFSEGKKYPIDGVVTESVVVWCICPHCGRDPQVELEFETLGAALERIASQECGDMW